ncbi:BnaC09g50660D [Brassica napus]|uniref:BnaC09g50660D protein n=1 Tax=Brassica napus TaxID=3708 RepID=A0A078I4R2_BRANA|nr:BnaC09g50660D [Brassica napus]
MVSETWFRNLWKFPKKQHEGHKEKEVLGVLAFEVASLLSKLVHLWQSLSDKNVARLRDEITRSTGIKKLVSEDDDFVVRLIREEMMESVENVAKAVARLSSKCSDPKLKSFESCFGEMMVTGADPYGWQFGWKKMDRKVKRMERFISSNASLYQETEILADLEQSFRRMLTSESATDNLLEWQRKVAWKRHEVKTLQDASLWNRTYDYTVLLLVRSIFTILTRTKHVFGISYRVEASDVSSADSDFIGRSQSVSTILTHQSESTGPPRFASGPLGIFTGPASGSAATRSTKMGDFLSLSTESPKSGPLVAEKNKRFNFYSGQLGKITSKSGPLLGMGKHNKKMGQTQTPERPSVSSAKKQTKPNRLTQVGPFKGCMVSHDGVNPHSTRTQNGARSSTLHYANVIIVIERFVASPHLIGDDARDDLYNMLPASVRTSLRERLKPYSKNLSSSTVYDPGLAKDWTDAMAGILEWLGPLAHNMIKWQSERSYEHQSLVSRTHIVLAQTLFFANQQKTETIITELLVGLNYVWRFGRELNAKALQECTTSSKTLEKCLDTDKK